MKIEDCNHPEYALIDGQTGEIVKGEVATQICTLCGAERINLNLHGNWRPSLTLNKDKNETEQHPRRQRL